jgi:hypothetical protein
MEPWDLRKRGRGLHIWARAGQTEIDLWVAHRLSGPGPHHSNATRNCARRFRGNKGTPHSLKKVTVCAHCLAGLPWQLLADLLNSDSAVVA